LLLISIHDVYIVVCRFELAHTNIDTMPASSLPVLPDGAYR